MSEPHFTDEGHISHFAALEWQHHRSFQVCLSTEPVCPSSLMKLRSGVARGRLLPELMNVNERRSFLILSNCKVIWGAYDSSFSSSSRICRSTSHKMNLLNRLYTLPIEPSAGFYSPKQDSIKDVLSAATLWGQMTCSCFVLRPLQAPLP